MLKDKCEDTLEYLYQMGGTFFYSSKVFFGIKIIPSEKHISGIDQYRSQEAIKC